MVEKNNNSQATMTATQMQERIKELEEQLAQKNNRTIYFRVAEESGSISIYGLNNRTPVSLYGTQWPRLIEAVTGKPLADDAPLAVFIRENSKYIANRDDTEEQTKQKKTLRLAEAHGVVNHPKNKQAA